MSYGELKEAILLLASYVQDAELMAQSIRDKFNDHQQLSLVVLVGTADEDAQSMMAVVSTMIEHSEQLLELANAYYEHSNSYRRKLG